MDLTKLVSTKAIGLIRFRIVINGESLEPPCSINHVVSLFRIPLQGTVVHGAMCCDQK